jgi:lactaldehyde dehydrogenase/glycolaldehyde dehydrogenase
MLTRDRPRFYSDGDWLEGAADARPVVNPATGEAFAYAPEASPEQALAALAAAQRAQPSWAAFAPIERAGYMHKIAALIRQNKEELARLVVREQGKPLAEARGEIDGAAEFFTYYAEFARRIQGEILPSDHSGEQIWIQRVPVGVVVAIIPWNYPAALVSRKVAPAMIAGNTIVLKPHELTPLSALRLAELFEEAGVPRGVVNVVPGEGATVGAALCQADGVDLISMTGSVPTGKRILAMAADRVTPVSLELGGKAPFIVMADADLDFAVSHAITSRFMNCGQVCICNERTLVQREVYDEFVGRYVEMASSLRIGDPMNETVDLGPKISLEELEKVDRYVQRSLASGAELRLGGARPQVPPTPGGYWYQPTVLTGVRPDMEIMREEVFGPVTPILPFDTFQEAVAISNDSPYGLSAYLFTNDLTRVMESVNDIRFGEIYVNRIGPESLQGFHVGYRSSGIGGDDGPHGLDLYLRKKTVYVNYSGKPPTALMPY